MRGVLVFSIVGLLSFVFVSGAFAQEDTAGMRALLTAKQSEQCEQYVYNACMIIPDIYRRGQTDSVLQLLDFMESECGTRYFADLRRLIEIDRGAFSGTLCGSETICFLFEACRFLQCVFSVGWTNRYQQSFARSLTPKYGEFIDSLSHSLLERTDSTTTAHYWLRFTTGDYSFLYRHLKAGDCPERCLQQAYDAKVSALLGERYKSRVHVGVIGGVWTLQDGADALGPKGEAGVRAGVYNNRLGIDLVLLVRFLKAKRSFIVVDEPKADTGRSFSGGTVGLDITYEMIRHRRHTIGLLGGVGYDWLGHIKEEDRDRATSESLNLNLGCRYLLAYGGKRTHYIGLDLRYHVLNYATGGGTDLSGNAVSLSLTWGWLVNLGVGDELNELGYYD